MGNTVDKFVDAVERLFESNLITAGREIRMFLISLTESEDAKDVIRSCSGGYLINEDYKRVVTEHGPLPASDEKKVAFITALLFAVDTGKLDLTELMRLLYPNSDSSTGYSKFLRDFIEPYAESFVNLIIGEPIPDVQETPTPTYDKMNSDVMAATNEIIAKISSSHYPDDVKENIKFAANGLMYALTFKDSFLTKIAYRGLTSTLRMYGIRLDAENYLTSTLRLYGVL